MEAETHVDSASQTFGFAENAQIQNSDFVCSEKLLETFPKPVAFPKTIHYTHIEKLCTEVLL